MVSFSFSFFLYYHHHSQQATKMVSFTTTAVGALIAITTLIQTVPAPPVLLVPAAIAGVVCLAGGSAAISITGQHYYDKHHHRIRRSLPAVCKVTDPRFSACVGGAMKEANITVDIKEDYRILVDGLPASCITQFQEYNDHLDTKSLDAQDGTITILNNTTVQIEGVPEIVVNEYIKAYTDLSN
jgi:hypothetical protein